MKMGLKIKFVLISCCLLLSHTVAAGSQQAKSAVYKPEEIAAFAKGVEKYAASQSARAFIIARVGRPAKDLPKGIQFTHTALAIYSSIQLDNGEQVNGYAIHNLYQTANDTSKSYLYTDFPVDFFWGAQNLKAGIIIPSQNMQDKLINIVASGKAEALHNPKYSVLSNPFNTMYQNCTEYTLDLINAAIYNTSNPEQLKVNAKAYFEPHRIKTNRFKLMLGATFMNDLSTKDHGSKVNTTTFTSIANYMQKYDLAQQSVVLDKTLKPLML